MPSLEQLATNLKDFKYYGGYGTFNQNNIPFGSDRPGGGSSGQPFIIRKPGQKWSPSNFDDGFTRAGAITTATRSTADVLRLGKFFVSLPQGPLFLAKQTGLQFMNPNLQHAGNLKTDKPTTGQGFLKNTVNFVSNTVNRIVNDYGPTRIYNPLGITTLAEAGVVGLGQHFMKHGLFPKYSDQSEYERLIVNADKEAPTQATNRLQQTINLISSLKYPDNASLFPMIEYKGGPNSFYGIGKTTINMIKDYGREFSMYKTADENSGFIYMTVSDLLSIPKTNPNSLTYPVDFRQTKNELNSSRSAGGTVLQSTNYKEKNIHTRIGVARSLTPTERRTIGNNYTNYEVLKESTDKVNMVSLFYAKYLSEAGMPPSDINNRAFKASDIRDLIKFRIKSIDNDTNNGAGVYMVFRAYISGIKRGIQSKWDPYNYVGRGESFYLYNGHTETISIQFTIAASSRLEMKPLYQKLNYLMSTLTPDYKNNRMRGNISELTVGDFIKYQPGIITNLDMSIDEDTQWEIALDEPENGIESDMHELPMIIKCSMTFIPIYNFLPRKSAEAPFIGLDDLESGNKKEWLYDNNKLLGIMKTDINLYEKDIIRHNERVRREKGMDLNTISPEKPTRTATTPTVKVDATPINAQPRLGTEIPGRPTTNQTLPTFNLNASPINQ
jgi:hypothetical protein